MGEIVLKTKNLSKYYKNKKVINNVNITIEKGDIYGSIGRNGAGKTTLIRIITALAMQDEGEIELFGNCLHCFYFNFKKQYKKNKL